MHTWLRNSDTGGVWACPDSVVDVYLARGWEPTDEPVDDEAHLSDPLPEVQSEGMGPGSDPVDHTVDEVRAYLLTDAGELKVTQDELDRVIAAEQNGKNRKGVAALADNSKEQ